MRRAMPIPVVTIIGMSGSGKTTLIEKLIPELKQKGYRLATVKHHSHVGFEIDQPGKDSWRYAQAGSDHVVIAAPDKIASYRLVEKEPSLDEIVSEIKDVDLILVEGYKYAGKPSIEIIRAELGVKFISKPEQLVACAANVPLNVTVPVLNLDDVGSIASFIEGYFLKQAVSTE
jgi:molybdopterin-guanine dinucleotide biosynthesis protein MobB